MIYLFIFNKNFLISLSLFFSFKSSLLIQSLNKTMNVVDYLKTNVHYKFY